MEGEMTGMRKRKDMILRPLPHWLCVFSTVADQETFRIFFMLRTSESRSQSIRIRTPWGGGAAQFFFSHPFMQTLYAKTRSLSLFLSVLL